MRKNTALNFDWLFKEKMEEKDLELGYKEAFSLVNIPHTNKAIPYNYFDLKDYLLESSYKKEFKLIKDLNKSYILSFGAIAQRSLIYLNAELLRENKCGYNEINIDITDKVKNGLNEIYVLVDSKEGYFPPFGNVVDYLGYGGIYREVNLMETSKVYMQDPFIYTKDLLSDERKLVFKTAINTSDVCTIHLNIRDNDQIFFDETFEYLNNEEKVFSINKPEYWSVDNPKLYRVKIELIYAKDQDDISFEYGFRDIKGLKEGFYLNGEKVLIRGLNRHQSFPYVGYAMPSSMQINDARILKNTLGLNTVRCSHYMQHKDFLNECDRLGLIVYEEFPGWQFIGNDEWKSQAYLNLDSMIKRDRNHPSIAFFGVRINESNDDDSFNIACYNRAKSLDPTRIICGTRSLNKGNFFDDCYAYNDFLLNNTNKFLQKKTMVTKEDHPYLISEYLGHMYPNKAYDNEERRTNIALKHKNIISKAAKKKNLMGSIGWVFADYNTHKDFGSGDVICHHGVLDMFRNPKLSSYPYSSLRKETFLSCTSDFAFGDFDASVMKAPYIFTNCDKVEVYREDKLLQTFDSIGDSIDERTLKFTDFYGDSLEKVEHYSPSMVKKIKYATKYVLTKGLNLNPLFLFKIGIKGAKETYKMYTKYVANWGNRSSSFRILGYKDDKLVKTLIKGPSYLESLDVSLTSDKLYVSDTYDVLEVHVRASSNTNDSLRYYSAPVTIDVSNNLEVIGPKTVSFYGGYASFYVKTCTKDSSQDEYIKINSENVHEVVKKVEIISKNNFEEPHFIV